MKPIEKETIRQILIDFAALPLPAREAFLSEMNAFLFASPQRRRGIVNAWKKQAVADLALACDGRQSRPAADAGDNVS